MWPDLFPKHSECFLLKEFKSKTIHVLTYVPLGGPPAAYASHNPRSPSAMLSSSCTGSFHLSMKRFSTDSRELLTPSSNQLTPLHSASFHLTTLST